MEIYLSYSTKIRKSHFNCHKDVIKLFEISIKLANKFNYNINIITDNQGYSWLKHIPVNSITQELESLNFKTKDVWSLGKLYAFNIISKKKKPFIHIDHDFFILKSFEKEVLDAEVIIQSIEFNLNQLNYDVSTFHKLCENKYYAQNSEHIDYSYNCGIIGGKNYEFFEEYSDSAIKMVADPANSKLWSQEQPSFAYWTKATLAEQYYLACCLDKFQIKPLLFFDNSKTKKNYMPKDSFTLHDKKAIHLYGHHKEIIKQLDRF